MRLVYTQAKICCGRVTRPNATSDGGASADASGGDASPNGGDANPNAGGGASPSDGGASDDPSAPVQVSGGSPLRRW
jgi:hypothetical protein